MKAISAHLGRDLWKRTLLCLTRGGITPPPPHKLPDLAAKRAEQLNSHMRKAGAPGGMPYTLVENSSRCEHPPRARPSSVMVPPVPRAGAPDRHI